MPLPGTRVIPPGWSDHHRPTATATMTATCTITRPSGPGATDGNGDYTPATPDTIYTGLCRVTPRTTDERLLLAGENQVTARRYAVAITHDAPEILVGDSVNVTTAVDPGLVGLSLRVLDVRYASEQWQRDLYTEEIEGVSA